MGVPELPKVSAGWLRLEAAQAKVLLRVLGSRPRSVTAVVRAVNRAWWSSTGHTWDQAAHWSRVAGGPV